MTPSSGGSLLTQSAQRLTDAGHSVTVRRLREFGSETGLSGRHPDTVRPIHDSFADFLAAFALGRSLAELPDRLGEHDRARRASWLNSPEWLAGLADRLTRDLPFTAVNVAPYERRPPEETWFDETNRHPDRLLPATQARPTVAYWQDTKMRVVAITSESASKAGWETPRPIAPYSSRDGRSR